MLIIEEDPYSLQNNHDLYRVYTESRFFLGYIGYAVTRYEFFPSTTCGSLSLFELQAIITKIEQL